jgi:hypothetical protein
MFLMMRKPTQIQKNPFWDFGPLGVKLSKTCCK